MANASDRFEADGTAAPTRKLDLVGLSPLVTLALKIADAEIGVTEQPPGSNRGPRVDEYVVGVHGGGSYLLGNRWCGRFARFVFEQASKDLGLLKPFAGAGDLASAIKWRDWARRTGRLRTDPQRGYVGLLLSGAHGHVVVCSEVRGEYAQTIEGNSGNAVRTLLRPRDSFAYWVQAVD